MTITAPGPAIMAGNFGSEQAHHPVAGADEELAAWLARASAMIRAATAGSDHLRGKIPGIPPEAWDPTPAVYPHTPHLGETWYHRHSVGNRLAMEGDHLARALVQADGYSRGDGVCSADLESLIHDLQTQRALITPAHPTPRQQAFLAGFDLGARQYLRTYLAWDPDGRTAAEAVGDHPRPDPVTGADWEAMQAEAEAAGMGCGWQHAPQSDAA